MKDSLLLAKAVKLGVAIARYSEAPTWESAHTDEDLTRALDSSRHRGEILALSDDGQPDDWTTCDICAPANGQLIYVVMDNWDKPSCGTYLKDDSGERIQLYKDKFLTIPSRRSAMFWKPCDMPEGMPKKKHWPEARGDAYQRDKERSERGSYSGHRDNGAARKQQTFPSDHSYSRGSYSQGDEYAKPGRDRRYNGNGQSRRYEK